MDVGGVASSVGLKGRNKEEEGGKKNRRKKKMCGRSGACRHWPMPLESPSGPNSSAELSGSHFILFYFFHLAFHFRFVGGPKV
jgi:hypothetical protein